MRGLPICFVALCLCACASPSRTLTVATFNAWGAGSNDGRPLGETVAVLLALNADVIALQESRAESPRCDAVDCPAAGSNLAAALAKATGFHVFEQPALNDALWANAILSRYPLADALPHGLGAIIDRDGDRIGVINVHLPDYPYQPYQLSGIDYGDSPMLDTETDAVASAESARGRWVDLLLGVAGDLAELPLVVVCGDFNEPSHLDWTERAVRAGMHPIAVRYPASRKLTEAGFVDGYRTYRPDEVRFPGFTWTPTAGRDDPGEHHDRIDFVYLRGSGLRVRTAAVVGESPGNADVVVNPWPSDHRAVRITVRY